MPRSHLARPTLRLIAAVAALAATVPVFSASADDIKGLTCSTARNVGRSWQAFAAPTFLQPQGLDAPTQDVVSYAVSPVNPRLLAVTNGNSIQVSKNGGCTWSHSLRLDQVPDPTLPLSGQFTKIRSLAILPNGRFVATAEDFETNASVGAPHVLLNDSGNSADWRLGDTGLPPVGSPLLLKTLRGSSNILYLSFANAKTNDGSTPCTPLTCSGDSGTPGLLWGSSDGGQTWSRRTDPGDLNGASVIRYFSVEDDDPTGRTLWVVANGLLRKSENGGASFTAPDGLNQAGFSFSAVESINKGDVKHPVKVVAFSSGGEMIRLEEGRGWIRSNIPFGAVESVSHRPEGDIVVATPPRPGGGGATVWRIYGNSFRDYESGDPDNPLRFRITYGWQSITPPSPVTVNARVSSSSGDVSTYFLRDKRRILRFLGSRLTEDVGVVPPVNIRPNDEPRGKLTPPNLTLNLPLGRSQVVDYTLTLPPAPTPIDLYLLVDNSGSMQPLIDELKRSLGDIAVSLVRSGVDVHIGVGMINVQPDRQELPLDNPDTPRDESKPRPVYQRLHPVGPVNGSLFQALSKIDGYGGSGSEAQLESLWQAAVGDGYASTALGPLIGYNVPKGQDARWREGGDVVRLIVHATDEAFSKNIENGHNEAAEVAQALVNMGIKQIGLSQGVPEAHTDLQDMAERTGAVAPRGGTDCDNDGRVDIRAGGPLVCEQNYGLDKTLVNLIKAIQDPQDLTVQVSKGVTLRDVSKTSFRINAKNSTKVGFKVTYTCRGVAPGSYVHDLKAGLRDRVIAQAVATVNCGNPPLRPQRPDVASPPQPPTVNPQPVPAPIAPVQPIPQPQVQGQPQVNPQVGAAEQKQRQAQLALAENDIVPEDEDQLAMVGLSHERNPAPATAVVIAGMAMASACAGALAYRRRTAVQVARASVR